MSHDADKPSVAVIYLARRIEGTYAMESFIDSYAKKAAGIAHDLVVIFKGYTSAVSLNKAKKVFSQYPHISFELPDEGFDLGSYSLAAQQLRHEYVCCLNTFSQIMDSNWLKKLYDQASLENVGIVGPTGSYESLTDSIVINNKIAWLNSQKVSKEYRLKLSKYFKFVIAAHTPVPTFFSIVYHDIYMSDRSLKQKVTAFGRFIAKHAPKYLSLSYSWSIFLQTINLCKTEPDYAEWWAQKLADDNNLALLTKFPLFPNPHIRTNGFMMKRQRFIKSVSLPIKTKEEAFCIESGSNSITVQVRKAGLKALIVGRDGIGYDVFDWCSSRTYRTSDCSNLLIEDNRTREYNRMSQDARTTLALISWGIDHIKVPGDFPDIGFDFNRLRVNEAANAGGMPT